MGAAELFHDDFSKFPPGLLSSPVGQLNGAIQEYHYLANRGVPLAPWENAICHQDAWIVSDENGKPYLEQHLDKTANMFTNALFITGDPEWSDYTVEALVKPLSLDDVAGVVFRYHTNHHYYSFTLSLGHTARLALRLPLEQAFAQDQWRELARVEFPYDVQRYYTLRVENDGAPHPGLHRRKAGGAGRGRGNPQGQDRRDGGGSGAIPGFPRHGVGRGKKAELTRASRGVKRSWPRCGPPIRSPSCGRSSPRRATAPAATCASAISKETGRSTC